MYSANSWSVTHGYFLEERVITRPKLMSLNEDNIETLVGTGNIAGEVKFGVERQKAEETLGNSQ